MNRTTEILIIKSVDQIPTLGDIRKIPRHRALKLVFDPSMECQREKIGENLKKNLCGFQVGIHTAKPEINIAKLITDDEIEANQGFFENCAKDYRNLSKELINKVANKLQIIINPAFPLLTFNPLRQNKRQIGEVNGWRYFLHGYHCGFENMKTGQLIEVPLAFGLEFGALDPYFFTKYIKSTPEYQPLPVEIYEDYADGVRINKKMLELGKFEKIPSNIENHFGIVVADRDKVETITYKEIPQITEKQKFNLWRFIGLK